MNIFGILANPGVKTLFVIDIVFLQLSAVKMVNVPTGRLFTIISLSLSFSTALFFPPVKREDPILTLTKP